MIGLFNKKLRYHLDNENRVSRTLKKACCDFVLWHANFGKSAHLKLKADNSEILDFDDTRPEHAYFLCHNFAKRLFVSENLIPEFSAII